MGTCFRLLQTRNDKSPWSVHVNSFLKNTFSESSWKIHDKNLFVRKNDESPWFHISSRKMHGRKNDESTWIVPEISLIKNFISVISWKMHD